MKKKIILICIVSLTIFYIGYQIYASNFAKVRTQPATYTTLNDSIQVKSFVVRDETYIKNSSGGVLSYLLDNGDKIAKDGIVAEIFNSSDDAKTQKEINAIDKEISNLKQLSYISDIRFNNPLAIDKQIEGLIQKMIKNVNTSNYQDLYDNISENLYLINERQVSTGQSLNFNDKINELQNKRDSLSKSHIGKIGTVLSPESGYFVSRVDGFENSVDFSNVLSLMPDDVNSIIESESIPIQDNSIVGKVIKGINWYIICNISSDDAFKMNVGKKISINLPLVLNDEVPATIVAINQLNRNSDAAIILSLDHMDDSLSLIRNETIKININTYSGLLINKKSLHEKVLQKTTVDDNGNEKVEEKKVQGVYILRGKELLFKQIVPIFSNNNYIICKQNPSEDELFKGETIDFLDEVVVEGMNLYDGKIIKW